MDFTVFSADPGTKNFACSVLKCRFKNERLQFKIVGTCMLPTTLTDIKSNAVEQLDGFATDIKDICRPHLPLKLVCIERFQSRGLGGNTIEGINMMLGVTARIFRKPEVRYITAATWKNRINKFVDLKASYKDYNLHRVITDKEIHELDSLLIGVYMAYQHVGLTDFSLFEEEGKYDSFIQKFLQSPNLLDLKKCK